MTDFKPITWRVAWIYIRGDRTPGLAQFLTFGAPGYLRIAW